MNSFKDFWPFYLGEHSNPLNRRIHFAGTFLVHVIVVLAILNQKWSLLWWLPLVGYGFAWAGHFFIQKNKPATFKHPLWSLIGDFKMFYLMCRGRLWKGDR
ncbi:Mpo1-like protein [Bdellovibrio bacteriovorus]